MSMSMSRARSGYFRSGIPYGRLGQGSRPLVVFQGMLFENQPQAAMARAYRFLRNDYTVFVVLRRPGLRRGCTLKDMADDYAAMIVEEFGGPVDVIGVSTGGSIAQHFAADHPDLVRRLVLHSSAHTLSDEAKRLQRETARLAESGRWREASALMIEAVLPPTGPIKALAGPIVAIGSRLMAWKAPADARDLVVTVEAEDGHAFRDRLVEITAETLVVAGAQDPFYTPALFTETAAGIPDARLILHENMGHPAAGRRFARDVLAFLRRGVAEDHPDRRGRRRQGLDRPPCH